MRPNHFQGGLYVGSNRKPSMGFVHVAGGRFRLFRGWRRPGIRHCRGNPRILIRAIPQNDSGVLMSRLMILMLAAEACDTSGRFTWAAWLEVMKWVGGIMLGVMLTLIALILFVAICARIYEFIWG